MFNQLKNILCQVIWAAVDASASRFPMGCSEEGIWYIFLLLLGNSAATTCWASSVELIEL